MSGDDLLDQSNLYMAQGKQDIVRFCQVVLAGGTYEAFIGGGPNTILLNALLPKVEQIQSRETFTSACLGDVFEKNEIMDEDAIEENSDVIFRAVGRSVGIKAFEMAAMGIKAKKIPGVNDPACDYVINLMRALKEEALFIFERPGMAPMLRKIEDLADLCKTMADSHKGVSRVSMDIGFKHWPQIG